jgi:hypothetical protein
MRKELSHLTALARMLAALDEDIRVNPDPRIATRELLAVAIAHIESVTPIYDIQDMRSSQNPIAPVKDRIPSPLIAPEITGKRKPRAYHFRDVMVAYLHQHGLTHRAKLAKIGVERGIFASEKVALRGQTRLFRIWHDVFMSDGHGYFTVKPDASADAKPQWSSTPTRRPTTVKAGIPSSKVPKIQN